MSTAAKAKTDARYLDLIRQFPLRPIRNKRERDQAMKIAGHLATYDEDTLPRGEQDYLDALTVLIDDYQRRQPNDMPEVTPLAMLKHLMEEHDMNISDLGRVIGSQSNASLILSGKREISKRVMRVLSEHFTVDPSVFLLSQQFPKVNDQHMKIDLNDLECYIAATALHVTSMELEQDIAAEPSMESRLWKLDLVDTCRDTMKKIDREWRYRFYKVHLKPPSERIAGFEKGSAPRRRISFDFEDRELEALTSALDIHTDGIGDVPAREVRALNKKLAALTDTGNGN